MNILDITSQSIRKGKLQSILPEYYQLKNFEENNPWHIHQNVFDHVVGVFEGLETVLKFEFLDLIDKNKIVYCLES